MAVSPGPTRPAVDSVAVERHVKEDQRRAKPEQGVLFLNFFVFDQPEDKAEDSHAENDREKLDAVDE